MGATNETIPAAEPKTAAEYETIIQGLTDQNRTLTDENAVLTTDNAAKTTQIDTLTAERDGYKNDVDEAEKLITGQKTTIDEQAARIEQLQSNPSTVPTFTVGTGKSAKTYEVLVQNFKFRLDGGPVTEYTVTELLKDTKLQAALIKKGVGFIVEKV
jgi:hypothetical protein